MTQINSNTNLESKMNEILLNIDQNTINLSECKENIEDIYTILYTLDPTKDKDRHKYLCLSCIFGAFMGDSMGSCCEFSYANPNNHLDIFQFENGIFAPGEVTDDSEMAMSAAFAYIDILNENPNMIQNLLYYYYGIWRCSGPKDIGGATTSALRFWYQDQSIKDTKFNNSIVRSANWDSLANGFLMRISTFISYYYYTHIKIIYETIQNFFNQEVKDDLSDEILNLYQDIYTESYKNVEITHPNYENGISSAVFTLITFVGMVTQDAQKAYLIFELISKSKKFIESHKNNSVKHYAQFVQEKYVEIISDITNNKPISVYSQMGYYLHGFKLSIHFLHKYPDMGKNEDYTLYYKIMCEVCDYGGDTDTNCAIVGAMVGPLIGYKNFSVDLFEKFIRFIPLRRCQYTSAFMYVYINYLEEKLLNEQTQKEEGKIIDNKIEEQKKVDNKDFEEAKSDIKEEEKTKAEASSELKDSNKKTENQNNEKNLEEKNEGKAKTENEEDKVEKDKEENKNEIKEDKLEKDKEENKNEIKEDKLEKDKVENKNENKEGNEEKDKVDDKNEIKEDNVENQKGEINYGESGENKEVKEETYIKEENSKLEDNNNPEIKNEKNLDIKDNTPMTPNKKEEFKYTAFKLILKFLNEKMDL